MGELKDAFDTINDLKVEFSQAGIYSTKRSISASAMEGTANFPVLVEDSISIDDGILISRAAEKKYASFLLTVLTMEPYLEVTKDQTPTASAYLRQFHQNIRVKNPVKGVQLNLLDFVNESYNVNDMDYSLMEGEAFKMAYAIYEGVTRSVPQDRNIELNYTIEEVTSLESLNEKFSTKLPILEKSKGTYVRNVDIHSDGDSDLIFNNPGSTTVNSDTTNINSSGNTTFRNTREVNNNGNGPVSYVNPGNVTNRMDTVNLTSNDAVTIRGARHVNQTVVRVDATNKQQASASPKLTVRDRGTQWKPLTDNDCKKANDLVPTLLHIRVYPIDKYTREELTPIDFIMGVKATLHPIPLNELARMVVSGMRNENLMFNFIRWTTGEIKFFKDFVFAIDTLKMDAKDAGRDVTGWRPALKRRKNLSKAKLRFSKNSVMPNTTIVVSTAGIDYIKETYGYDLSDERIINRMMDVYFLLAFINVDSVKQRATFKFDGIDTTDTYTFDTLKRETQNDDKAFKNMMKMLGRSM